MFGKVETEVLFGHLPRGIAWLFDALSIGSLLAIFFGWLPHVTSLLAFCWVCVRLANELMIRRKLKKEERGE